MELPSEDTFLTVISHVAKGTTAMLDLADILQKLETALPIEGDPVRTRLNGRVANIAFLAMISEFTRTFLTVNDERLFQRFVTVLRENTISLVQ